MNRRQRRVVKAHNEKWADMPRFIHSPIPVPPGHPEYQAPVAAPRPPAWVRVLRRFTPWPVIALSPLLIIPVGLAAEAKAAPVDEYTAINADAICSTIAEYPYLSTVSAVVEVIVTDTGWSYYDAGQVVGKAVYEHCPWNRGTVDRFIRVYAPAAARGEMV